MAQIGKYLAQNGLKMHDICTFLTLLANMCTQQLFLRHFSKSCISGTTCHSFGCPNICLVCPNMTIFGIRMLKMHVFPPIQPIFAHIEQVLSNFPIQTWNLSKKLHGEDLSQQNFYAYTCVNFDKKHEKTKKKYSKQ